MKNTPPLPALLAALVVAGCAMHASAPLGLTGTNWQLEELNGRGAVGHKASLAISREGRMGGNTGCNAMFGHAKLDGNHVVFETIGSTKMACVDPEIMDQEHRYFDALKQVATWRIDDGRLYLTDRARKDVLVFEPE